MINFPSGRGNFFSNHQKGETIFRNVAQRELRRHFVDSIACFRDWCQACDSAILKTSAINCTAAENRRIEGLTLPSVPQAWPRSFISSLGQSRPVLSMNLPYSSLIFIAFKPFLPLAISNSTRSPVLT